MHLPKNHPLIILTNITRHIIDKAHSNSTTIHPNTILYKILNHAEIFASFEAQKESVGNASHSSLKFSEIWSSIADSCQNLLKPKNPQTNYNNKLHNKLTDLNQQLKDEHLKLFNQTYTAELERDLLNPHKPAKDFKKPAELNCCC